MFVLEIPSPPTLLNDAGLDHLSAEPAQELLLGLVLGHHHLHVVRRPEEERVGVRHGWAYNRGQLRRRSARG